MAVTRTATPGATSGADPRGVGNFVETVPRTRLIGQIVASSLIGGLLVAVFLLTVALVGSTETVITGSVPLTFAPAWVALAILLYEDAPDGLMAARNDTAARSRSSIHALLANQTQPMFIEGEAPAARTIGSINQDITAALTTSTLSGKAA